MVAERLESQGRCLIVDCHSFPSTLRPCDLDRSTPRPDVCIGTDPYHTPRAPAQAAVAAFEAHGHWVEVDKPYRGTIVPGTFLGRDPRVASVMVEISRRLYMDEATGKRLPSFDQLREQVAAALRSIAGAIC
jgi:N-formylglutamate amidohydrolase